MVRPCKASHLEFRITLVIPIGDLGRDRSSVSTVHPLDFLLQEKKHKSFEVGLIFQQEDSAVNRPSHSCNHWGHSQRENFCKLLTSS